MAKRTIGMVNQTGTKVGIEGAFDSVLHGIDGNVLMQRISGTFRVPVPDEMNVDPVDGIDVVTTSISRTWPRKRCESSSKRCRPIGGRRS